MESCIANLTASCPTQFSGISGAAFAQAISTVAAVHCAYVDAWPWPPDRSADILNSQEKLSYDFVIVGAGTAGSLLASRLSQVFPEWTILLIEAGEDPGPDSDMPSFFFANQASAIDWDYKTAPDPGHCLGFQNGNCHWSKGKAMGGSSSINAMIYIRGHAKDFDDWEAAGNPGWSYNSVSKYFDKSEKVFQGHDIKSDDTIKHPWYDIIEKAWREFGLNHESDVNNEARIGARKVKISINKGRRFNTAKVNLNGIKNNLSVMKNTIAQKVIIDKDTMTATGVQIRHASGIVMEISAKREVILSAGSIATPQILMHSGIGPKEHLSEIKIESLLDMPVGKNLQDHVLVPIFMQVDEQFSHSITPEVITLFLLQYMLTKTGPFAGINVVDFMSFIDTSNKTNYPDIQYFHMHFPKRDGFTLRSIFKGIGYEDDILDTMEKLNKNNDLFVLLAGLLHPESRGEILLHDSNPLSKPIVKANYFKDTKDIETFKKSIESVKKLLQTTILQRLGVKLAKFEIKGCSSHEFNSDHYWECYIRHLGSTIYHPVGTAKMGKDKNAVVNHELLVKGVNGLRVVDASIMPRLTSANTMAPTMMIAEKAADLVQKQWSKHKGKDEL